MTFGRVRLSVERTCPDCRVSEEVSETVFTEQHRERVVSAAEASGFSSDFEHDSRCPNSGDVTPDVTARVLDVDERLANDVDVLRRRYEALAEALEDEGEDPYTAAECRAAIEAIDRVLELSDGRDRVDENPMIDLSAELDRLSRGDAE